MNTQKKTGLLFAIAIMICGSISATKTHAQQQPPPIGIDLGEEGSNEIRIEPTNSPLGQEVLAMLRTQPGTGTVTRKSLSGISGEVIWFIKPPDNSSLYLPFRPNMMEGLKTKRVIGTGETVFIPLPDGSSIKPSDITVTPYNNGGRYPSPGVVFRSTAPSSILFTLADVSYRLSSSDKARKPLGELGLSGDFKTNTLSITRIGVQAGADGTLGTTDDIIYTSGSSSIGLHALIYRGVANWFEERSLSNFGDVERYIAGNQPFTETAEYFVANRGSVSGTIKIVPTTTPTPLAPVITFFSANVTTILQGNSVIFNWGTQNATSANILGIGAVALLGPLTVTPIQTTTYALTATGPGGTATSQQVTIVVNPQPQPASNITPRISLTPSGTVVTGGALLVTTDNINNGSGNYFGTITNVIQVRRSFAVTGELISDWSPWTAPGTSFTSNLLAGEAKAALSYPWNADGADGIKHELRAVESDSSGTHISSVVSVQVVPAQPSPAAFKLAVSLSPTGTVVTQGGLQLTATVSHVGGTAYFGTFTFRAQSSTDGGKTWTTWLQAGVGTVTGLGVGETKTAFSFPWKADGVDNKVYQFRIVGTTSDGQTLESGSTPTVIVVQGAIGPITLGIRQGNSVDLTISATPGTYNIEESVQPNGPWVFAKSVTFAERGTKTETFAITGPMRFWRVRTP